MRTFIFITCLLVVLSAVSLQAAQLNGRIVDADSGSIIPARLYVQSSNGQWHFVRSKSNDGSAVIYDKSRSQKSVEKHTTLSAHPFVVDLPVGTYTLTAERGKEYKTVTKEVIVGDESVEVTLKLKRWINMAECGWFSGDTHVHRKIAELPNIVMAEDLNVALPLSYWVTRSGTAPKLGEKDPPQPEVIRVDDTHVIYPINTEYEIFTVNGKRHTLGAVFLLNHKEPFELTAPPIGPIAAEARRQGALIDMDKHSWPWSMMLVPTIDVDLFELTNNHIWRTEFAFKSWTKDTVPRFMQIETDRDGFTEKGWIDFGLKTYYLLLNCGFRLRPSAGTASGVHPVPLGFGRVYVHMPDGFSYGPWMKGLNAGRSFVTTGPMLPVTFDDKSPGHTFEGARTVRVKGVAHSARRVRDLQIIVNGAVAKVIEPVNRQTKGGGFESAFDERIVVGATSWIAVRCFEPQADGRMRFAHTAPVHVDVRGKPLRPTPQETGYLVQRMEQEIQRHRGVLDDESLAEYERALNVFLSRADPDPGATNFRTPKDDDDLRGWLQNMVWHHRFNTQEIVAATGLGEAAINQALTRFDINGRSRPKRKADEPLLVVPYPGGRHPRIGFIDGAIRPQRETKVSVFTPWDDTSYVVVDVPEAIHSDKGLLYLAHTHVPTIWTRANAKLPPLEWERRADGSLFVERRLPNNVVITCHVRAERRAVRMELSLTNGSDQTLKGLRVQNCVMLKGAKGFDQQDNANKHFQKPYAAVRSGNGHRWIITAWENCGRVWANTRCPCMHADPVFPDCEPGQTKRLHGWLSFYEGESIQTELTRINELEWWKN